MSKAVVQQLCWSCKNAVPDDVGHGCEWSEGLRPVPGWEAVPVFRQSMGDTWSISQCPKYDPEPIGRKLY